MSSLATAPRGCDDCCSAKASELERLGDDGRRRVLVIVLAINAVMFAAELGAGLIARSTALIADSVDMLGDAFVYALSLYALSRGARWKAGAALVKGIVLLGFGAAIAVEIGLKLAHGATPLAGWMAGVGAVALAANLTCLMLLWRHRSADINMESTFECSRNDVIANVGVVVAAAGVAWSGAAWPDIAAGALVALVFLRSAIRITGRAAGELRSRPASG
jgi:cation diffusion facilitator family transporter